MLTKSEIDHICYGDENETMRKALHDKEACNGWTNPETWMVNLWLSNEQRSSDHAYGVCDPKWGRTHHENGRLLKAFVEELAGFREATMRHDMFNCAMDRVVWSEVAEHFAER